MWPFTRKQSTAADAPTTPAQRDPVARYLLAQSTHMEDDESRPPFDLKATLDTLKDRRPRPLIKQADGTVTVMDGCDDDAFTDQFSNGQPNISGALAEWYGTQGFIGHQLAAIIAQHWLIWKACATPARDAIRNGFDTVTSDGDSIPDALQKVINKADKRMGLRRNLLQFISMGRVFGIRVCIFQVDGTDYELPFNINNVQPGSYRGMVQVDPYWMSPILDGAAASQPDSMYFYEPTWWLINGKRYHRSHLAIFRNGEVADILKPSYLYGGFPVPQQIMERVYGAERIANEAPLLALTKRTMVYKTDTAKAASNFNVFSSVVAKWSRFWSNNGVRVIGEDDEIQQIDTSLSDFDNMTMTQYQLVAAGANVPSTKLLGTAPKGFNATGEYDESNYHEELESLQTHDLSPMVDRHHMLCVASARWATDEERVQMMAITLETEWHPLDTPTLKELAEVNKLNAEADAALVNAGAIDGTDARRRIATDTGSNYSGLQVAEELAQQLPTSVDPGTPAPPLPLRTVNKQEMNNGEVQTATAAA